MLSVLLTGRGPDLLIRRYLGSRLCSQPDLSHDRATGT